MAAAAPTAAEAPRPRISLRPTRAGAVAGCTALVLLLAAMNTGNNLHYLLAALLFASLPLSLLLARRALRGLSVELLLPAEATAGEAVEAALRLSARARPVAGLRLLVEPSAEPVDPLPFLGPGDSAVRSASILARRRGPLLVRVLVEALFPWGLLALRAEADSAELLVLPRGLGGAGAPLVLGPSLEGRSTLRPGSSQDLLEIRDYRPGDDARSIDWKATARRDRPMVRLGTEEEERRVCVVVDPSLPEGDPEQARERVEAAIGRAAGASIELRRQGFLVRLLTPSNGSLGSESEQLRILARLELPPRPLAEGWWRARLAPGEPHVLCRARGDR